MKDEYDVIVVGAGPAGSLAAKEAAKGGLSVLLIEKRQEIGDPVRCAEAVGHSTASKYLDFDEKSICTEITTATLILPNGLEFVLGSEGPEIYKGYVLDRKIFDRELANDAAKAGAEVRVKTAATGLIIENGQVCGVKVRHLGKEKEIRCKIVIGADGVESKVGKWAGLDTTLKLEDIESCVQYLVSGVSIKESDIRINIGNEVAPGGYLWEFPKGNNKANIGIGLLGSRVKNGARPIDCLNKFIEEKYPDAKILEMHFGADPVSSYMEKYYGNGFMLAGDAARMVDPITGGGIETAIVAGALAGQRAVEAVEANDFSEKFLKEYQKRWEKEYKNTFKRSLILKNFALGLTDEIANQYATEFKKQNIKEPIGFDSLIKALTKMDKTLLLKLGISLIKS
ncbi:MAG: NAD(P)/FAD-dependent oxidoreductase [Methanosarcinaceae archaeon]|nr:NAD(P)/FAD-dependent oxidoreductase [Methanosarcinaceae archaeon]